MRLRQAPRLPAMVLRRDHGGDNSTAAVTEERHLIRPDERLSPQKVDCNQHGLLREGAAIVRRTGGVAIAGLGEGCRHVALARHDPETACPNIGFTAIPRSFLMTVNEEHDRERAVAGLAQNSSTALF